MTFKNLLQKFYRDKKKFLKIFKNKVTSNSIPYLFNENKYLSNDIKLFYSRFIISWIIQIHTSYWFMLTFKNLLQKFYRDKNKFFENL